MKTPREIAEFILASGDIDGIGIDDAQVLAREVIRLGDGISALQKEYFRLYADRTQLRNDLADADRVSELAKAEVERLREALKRIENTKWNQTRSCDEWMYYLQGIARAALEGQKNG